MLTVLALLSLVDNGALSVSGPMLSRLVTPALFEKPVRGTETISCLGIKQQPVLTGELNGFLQPLTDPLVLGLMSAEYFQLIKNSSAFMEHKTIKFRGSYVACGPQDVTTALVLSNFEYTVIQVRTSFLVT